MAIRCDRCGAVSEIEVAYAAERSWFGLIKRRYCPTCYQKRQTRGNIWNILFYGVSLAAGIYLVWRDPYSVYGGILLFMGGFFIVSIPMIALHELSHTLAARLMDFRVFSTVIGIGKLIASKRFLGINWEIRQFPVGGYTVLGGPLAPNYRLRMFLTILAGPAVHVILLPFLVVFSWLLKMILPSWGPAGLLASTLGNLLVWTNLILLGASLLPVKKQPVFGATGSDGWLLLTLPTLKDSVIANQCAGYYAMESMDAYRQGDFHTAKHWSDLGIENYPGNTMILNTRGVVLISMQCFGEARETFTAMLAAPEPLKPEVKYILLNNIAYVDIILNDPGLLHEADQYSAEAYQNAPWVPSIAGTRGAVLVELGELDEGIKLLTRALADHTEGQEKASNACHLAIAESRRGKPGEARRYLDMARALDPSCYLLGAAERELAAFQAIS